MHSNLLKIIVYLLIYVFVFLLFNVSSQSIKVIFPHEVHQSEVKCRDCHHMYSNIPYNHFPDENKCLDCHDETDFDFHSRPPLTKSFQSKFSHLEHRKYSCQQCHHVTSMPLPALSANCKNCHKRQQPNWHTGFFRIRGHGIQAQINSNKCSFCHQSSFCVRCHRSTKPMNHKGNWASLHGKAIPGGYGGNISNCSTCHKTTWCIRCHNRKIQK